MKGAHTGPDTRREPLLAHTWRTGSAGADVLTYRVARSISPFENQGLVKAMSVTQAEFRKALGCFATGVTVITLDAEGEVHGMTANAFTSVSLDPMLVLVCVDQRARTHSHLHAKKRFGVNVLAEDQRAISEYYARPARTHDRAAEEAGAVFEHTSHGTPVLQGALAYLECRLHTAQDAGDHTIFIAEVEDVVVREGAPLLYFESTYREIGPAITPSVNATGVTGKPVAAASPVSKRRR